ncbi:energy transducer TonB [Roseateles chitinivorans]|uniref:energy transducer TonB n=1 Tax=Roseateles chitinivorans TaxID=2917965 RepID=UPI003D674AF0
MSSRSLPSVRHQGRMWCQVLSLGLGLVAMGAQAQTAQPVAPATSAVPAAAAAVAPMSDVDRAKRDADKVFQWIKFHAEKGEKKPAHEAKAEAPRPVARPVAVTAPAPATVARRQDADPARNAQDAAPVPVVASASPAPAAIGQSAAQTIAPPTSVPPPMSEAPSPQVVSMSAPSSAVSAGKVPDPEPEADEPVPLKLLHKVDPEYPRALLSQQRSGSVLVQFTVRPDGAVDAAQAVRSPDRKLSVAAVTAVKQWRFGPIPAPRQVSVEIGFQAAE